MRLARAGQAGKYNITSCDYEYLKLILFLRAHFGEKY